MSDPETQTQPLMRTASQQTGMDQRPPGQGARPTQAYKVAGLTVVACVLIFGQAAIAYMVFSQRSDIKSLQEQNAKMKMDLTSQRTVSLPMRMQVPMQSMLELTSDGLDEESSAGASDKATSPLTRCQQESSGLKDTRVPGFRPDCDKWGLYEAKQCFQGTCWCVKPESGDPIPGSETTGKVLCGSNGRQRMGKFATSLLMTETVAPDGR